MSKKENHLKNFTLIAILLIIISIGYPFGVNYFFSDWTKSGTFGDTYGALNALFSGLALAGVIVTILIQKQELQNQRVELELQRNEMKETRKEFLMNRTTSLVYNQLNRFEKYIENFNFDTNMEKLKGDEAITFLDKNLYEVYQGIDKSDEQFKKEKKTAIIKLLKLYNPNESNITEFAQNIYNTVEVLQRLIFKSNLEIEELNDLKNLFFVNIGFVKMGVIERISKIQEDELEFMEPEDYIENGFSVEQSYRFSRARIFLKPVIEFSNLRIKEENFEEEKRKWESRKGNLG
ncbi:hypothetical protein [Mesonia aquimarina]|uniref:hypothetical protein n=1 Tax=Mesonia aquimarina TaxID=1504967 RepID=UPI000EF5B33A|nr:hypothetical protein [Mesonia aquimarina]